jgi:DNA polymerase-1
MEHKVNIELSLVKVLTLMEYHGSNFDAEPWKLNMKSNESRLKVLENYMDSSLKRVAETCDINPKKEHRYLAKRHKQDVTQVGLFGDQKVVKAVSEIKVNYSSPAQIQAIFKDFNQPVPTDKHDKPSVGKEPMAKYALVFPNSPLKDFIGHYREYVQVKKKISSFGQNILDMIDQGRLRSAYRQLGTATGRLASGDARNGYPNMNQIPRDNAYRTPFTADPGYVYMTIDYSSCELVILAAQSGDETLKKLLSDPNLDLHSYLANAAWSEIKGRPYQVTKEERQVFKAVNFGLVYGATVYRIADILNISVDDAKKVMDALRNTIPKAFAYLDKVGDEAVRQGYVVFNTRTRARRWFPEVFTAREARRYLDRGEVGSVKRKAMNAPIQGTNADITKEAMVEVDKILTKVRVNFPKTRIVMQVYDEIVIQLPENFLDGPLEVMIKRIMEETANKYLRAAGSDLEMGSDYKIEETWIK